LFYTFFPFSRKKNHHVLLPIARAGHPLPKDIHPSFFSSLPLSCVCYKVPLIVLLWYLFVLRTLPYCLYWISGRHYLFPFSRRCVIFDFYTFSFPLCTVSKFGSCPPYRRRFLWSFPLSLSMYFPVFLLLPPFPALSLLSFPLLFFNVAAVPWGER